ncbi:alpha/beta hydrolase [Pseudohalioglobus sediminis]|uniref:Alpha/beta hydrolase n=1 Tax=Pseudohalioglobus sediminis TaxID=2606449 RepID=A0A5B0X810_9GAMM|nr:alpha/beta hydrolase [Pseudohalioglobus sediminis]
MLKAGDLRLVTNAPLLAIHGSAATGRQWDSLRDQIGEARAVLAPDLPGYGDNLNPLPGKQVGLGARAQPLVDLLASLSYPVHVVAHSFGAAIALELVRTLPGAVRSLWLYEPVVPSLLQTAGTERDLALRSDLACLADMLDRANAGVAMAAFIDFWHGGACWQHLSASRQALLAMQANVVLQDFREAFAHPLPGTALRRFSAPAHIVAGGDATVHATRMAALLAELLPNSSRSSMAGMGHMGPCTHPETVNAAIRAWLDHAENHQPQTLPVEHSPASVNV